MIISIHYRELKKRAIKNLLNTVISTTIKYSSAIDNFELFHKIISLSILHHDKESLTPLKNNNLISELVNFNVIKEEIEKINNTLQTLTKRQTELLKDNEFIITFTDKGSSKRSTERLSPKDEYKFELVISLQDFSELYKNLQDNLALLKQSNNSIKQPGTGITYNLPICKYYRNYIKLTKKIEWASTEMFNNFGLKIVPGKYHLDFTIDNKLMHYQPKPLEEADIIKQFIKDHRGQQFQCGNSVIEINDKELLEHTCIKAKEYLQPTIILNQLYRKKSSLSNDDIDIMQKYIHQGFTTYLLNILKRTLSNLDANQFKYASKSTDMATEKMAIKVYHPESKQLEITIAYNNYSICSSKKIEIKYSFSHTLYYNPANEGFKVGPMQVVPFEPFLFDLIKYLHSNPGNDKKIDSACIKENNLFYLVILEIKLTLPHISSDSIRKKVTDYLATGLFENTKWRDIYKKPTYKEVIRINKLLKFLHTNTRELVNTYATKHQALKELKSQKSNIVHIRILLRKYHSHTKQRSFKNQDTTETPKEDPVYDAIYKILSYLENTMRTVKHDIAKISGYETMDNGIIQLNPLFASEKQPPAKKNALTSFKSTHFQRKRSSSMKKKTNQRPYHKRRRSRSDLGIKKVKLIVLITEAIKSMQNLGFKDKHIKDLLKVVESYLSVVKSYLSKEMKESTTYTNSFKA